MFWSCASLDVSLIRIHLISIFFFPPVDASLPGGVVLTRAFSSSRQALRCCFFFLFFFPVALALVFFFRLFFPQSQSLALVLIFSVCFFQSQSCALLFFFPLFFSFLWSCVLCRGYMCCVYSYSIILVIMNMGCRSIMCMIGYCHCQFVREGGGKTGWATGGPVFDAPTLGVAEGW